MPLKTVPQNGGWGNPAESCKSALHQQCVFIFEKISDACTKVCKESGGEQPVVGGDDELREENVFCRAFLRTMDPERAAAEAGKKDGFSALKNQTMQKHLDEMRFSTANQIRREDVIRRLAQLAFGRANDAAKLVLHPNTADPDTLDLSALSELKVTDKGVEVKLIDRVRALETLYGLLESGGDGGAAELYQALEDAAGQLEGGWGDG